MHNTDSYNKGYLCAAALGAIGGGLLVLAAKAISNIVPFMKEKMAGGCS